MKAINECDQNRIDAASGLFPVILNPVGLIGSPAAIRAYLAHEAKKKPCPVCGSCDDWTRYYPAIERDSVINVVLKMREQ